MRRIAIDHIQEGMVVAQSVTNGSGLVLLQRGAALTPALIARLRDHGVAELVVVGDDPNAPSKTVEERLRELDERFEGHEQDPIMMAIKRIAASLVPPSDKAGPDA